MTADIVTRLQMFSLDDGTDALNKLLAESADEIAYLQIELKEARSEYQKLRDKNERLRAELTLAIKWQDNYKLAFERCQEMLVRRK